MRKLVEEASLAHAIAIDSAGMGDWHVGEPPDRRSAAAARKRQIEIVGRARQFSPGDFAQFDYVLAMDQSNLRDLLKLAPHEELKQKIELFRNYDPGSPRDADVPDPYYGGVDGFERVIDICIAACEGLLAHIRSEHGL
jgi:protein-tyrosine phosphatase